MNKASKHKVSDGFKGESGSMKMDPNFIGVNILDSRDGTDTYLAKSVAEFTGRTVADELADIILVDLENQIVGFGEFVA